MNATATKADLLKINLFDFKVPQATRLAAIKAKQEACSHIFGGPKLNGGQHCFKCGFIKN